MFITEGFVNSLVNVIKKVSKTEYVKDKKDEYSKKMKEKIKSKFKKDLTFH